MDGREGVKKEGWEGGVSRKERREKGRGGKEGWRRVGERKEGRKEERGGRNNKIVTKFCPFRYRKPPEHQTDLTKIETLHGI
jgi:hypothetical protein